MRDCKLIVTEKQGLDIDFINGEPAYLDYEDQTNDQRAAVACYMVKGTVPGREDLGVSWGKEFSNEHTVLNLSNEVQQAVQSMAGSSTDAKSNAATGYNAQIVIMEGETGVIVTRS